MTLSRGKWRKEGCSQGDLDELKPDRRRVLRWNLSLKPGEKKDLHLKFSVEYPTDMTVSALE